MVQIPLVLVRPPNQDLPEMAEISVRTLPNCTKSWHSGGGWCVRLRHQQNPTSKDILEWHKWLNFNTQSNYLKVIKTPVGF